jgi:ATP-dependent Clp protease protease subunit
MIHQPSGGYSGQVTDVEIHAKEMLRLKHALNEMLAYHTGQPVEKISKEAERDNFMSASEAKTYGIIDSVYSVRPTPLKPVN